MDKGKLLVKNIILTLLLLWASSYANAQIVTIDTSETQEVQPKATEIHSPKKAAIYSAVLPGLGQAYNKKYWKIPLVYIGFGTIGYFIDWNNGNYKTFRLAYYDLTDGDSSTNSFEDLEVFPSLNLENQTDYNNFKTGLKKQTDYYRRNRDLLVLSMLGFYGLQIIDASVDAHFFDFDISEDLTFNWQPAMKTFETQMVYGVNCTFKF